MTNSQNVFTRSTSYAILATGWMIGSAAVSSLTFQDPTFPPVVSVLSSMVYFGAAAVYFAYNEAFLTRYSLPAGGIIAMSAFVVLHGTHVTAKELLIWSPVISCSSIFLAVHIVPTATLTLTNGFLARPESYHSRDLEQGLVLEASDLEPGIPEDSVLPELIEPLREQTEEPPDQNSSVQEQTRIQGRNAGPDRFGLYHHRITQGPTVKSDGELLGTGDVFRDDFWHYSTRANDGSSDESLSLSSKNSKHTIPSPTILASIADVNAKFVSFEAHEHPGPKNQLRVPSQTSQQICALSTVPAGSEIQHSQNFMNMVPAHGIPVMENPSVTAVESKDHPTRVTGSLLEPMLA